MWSDYFILVGILFASYLFMRMVVEPVIRLPPPVSRYQASRFDGKGIEASVLTERLGQVRAGLAASKPPDRPHLFKRELLVESKREEMRKLAFFQNPPPSVSKPPPHDPGLPLLLA